MTTDNPSDKTDILGELESINALLCEPPHDGIPVLNEMVDASPLPHPEPSPPHPQQKKTTSSDTRSLALPEDLIPTLTNIENPDSISISEKPIAEHDKTTPPPSNDQLDIFINPSTANHTNVSTPPVTPVQPASPTLTPVKARGENPFLPKHIRDRLHTNKALLDIINEYKTADNHRSLATVSKNKTPDENNLDVPVDVKAIIEQIIADYLPQIEAELRTKLIQHAREGKLYTTLPTD